MEYSNIVLKKCEGSIEKYSINVDLMMLGCPNPLDTKLGFSLSDLDLILCNLNKLNINGIYNDWFFLTLPC